MADSTSTRYSPQATDGHRLFSVVSVVGVTLAYAFLALVVTYPACTDLTGSLAQTTRDGFQYVYLIWWAREALKLRGSLAFLRWVYYPAGLYNPLTTAYALFYLVGLVFEPFLSPVETFNILTLLSFVLSGVNAYALCTYLTGNRWAGFFGGLVYAFAPCLVAHASSGHLELISVYPFPLYLLLLIRGIRRPRVTTAILCAIALAASMLVHPMYIPYLLMPITIIWLAYEWVVLKLEVKLWTLLYLLGVVGIATALALPFYWPILRLQAQQGGEYLVESGVVIYSADLLAFVSPSPTNPVLGALGLIPDYARRVIPSKWAPAGEATVYLGFVPLLLAALAAWRKTRRCGAWILIATVSVVLALGPLLRVGGRLVSFEVDGFETHVPLPYALLSSLPFLSMGRTPSRFAFALMLALAVISAHGVAILLRRLSRRWGLVLLFGLSILTMSEYLIDWPYPTTELQIPNNLLALAETGDNDAVLNLPLSRGAKLTGLLYQTFHRRPLFDSWVQRPPPLSPDVPKFLEGLLTPRLERDIIPAPDTGVRAAVAKAFDVGYVLLHTHHVERAAAYADFLAAELDEPFSAEETLAIYRVPSRAAALKEPVYVLPTGEWLSKEHLLPVESWGGRPARWMLEQADLYIYSPDEVEQEGLLRFTALPLVTPSRLQVEVNGLELPPLAIGDWMTYTTHLFTLRPGLNQITFRALDGCIHLTGDPRCTGPARAAGADCAPYLRWERCLSILFQDVRFVPRAAGPAANPLDVTLSDRVRFLGYDLAGLPTAGKSLALTLYWQALEADERDHVIFAHLVGPDGLLIAQQDAPPLGGSYPASEWTSGDVFLHRVALRIPADVPPGEYDLLVGMYTYPDIERLTVASDRPYAQDSLIWLQRVDVRP